MGLLAFVVYALTLCVGAYPGESANLALQYLGVLPRFDCSHPIWSGVVWLVARMPVGDAMTRLNLLSAIFGAVAAGLVCRVVAGAIHLAIIPEEATRKRAEAASLLAGGAASLALIFSAPFWVVSNRFHPASFDILFLMTTAWLLLRFVESGKWWKALAYSLMCGLGVVEFTTMAVFAPLAALALVLILWMREELRLPRLLAALGCALLGLTLYLIAAAFFYGSEGYQIREYSGYFNIIWITWREQFFLITRCLPKQGWLLVVVVGILPWLISLCVAHRGLNGEKDWTYYILHISMTILAAVMLLNLRVSPWGMPGPKPFLVTPYVLTAVLYGYLAAYWFLLPMAFCPEHEENRIKVLFCRWLSHLVLGPIIGLLVFAAIRNAGETNGRGAAMLRWFAAEVVDSLEGREWLVTDGLLDAQCQLAARDRGATLNVINLRLRNSQVLAKVLASRFEDTRMRNLAQLGIVPLLQGWLKEDPEVERKLAVMSDPDIWVGSGFEVIPNILVFLGWREGEEVDALALFEKHQAFWKKLQAAPRVGPRDPLLPLRDYLYRHMGKVANNLGVLLEDAGEEKAAFAAYRQAREIDPENVSALLNMDVMIQHGFESALKEEIDREIEALKVEVEKGNVRVWSLSRYYGYVRLPESFAAMGWAWAASGNAGMAVSEMKRAMELLPRDRQQPVKQALAGFYLLQEQNEESEALYYELLVENPEHPQALLGMARLKIPQGKFSEALDLLSRAQEAGTPRPLVDLERATVQVATGKPDEALLILEDLVDVNPNLIRAWSLMVHIYIQRGEPAELEKCLGRLDRMGGAQGLVQSVGKAHLAMLQNDFQAAVARFEEAQSLRPQSTEILEWLVRLNMLLGRKQETEERAKELLRVNPDHAFANHILGMLQMEEGENELAEDSLRRAVTSRRSPIALNDLAWLLQERGKLDEAEKLTREALKSKRDLYQAWDTLGTIFAKTGRDSAAEKAFKQALAFAAEDPAVLLHLAELYIRTGNTGEAVKLVETVESREDDLRPDYRALLASIRERLEQSGVAR